MRHNMQALSSHVRSTGTAGGEQQRTSTRFKEFPTLRLPFIIVRNDALQYPVSSALYPFTHHYITVVTCLTCMQMC
jgi:hypothetical protein